MDRVKLNADEAAWFARNVIKSRIIMDAKSKESPEILKRETYKVLSKIENQARVIEKAFEAGISEGFTADIILSKKQRSVIRKMVNETVKILDAVIIPKYASKGLTEYETDAKIKSSLLKTMARKFK